MIGTMSTMSVSVRAAATMTVAGAAFAGLNVAIQWATMSAGAASTAVAFWQYLIALMFSLPMIWRDLRLVRTANFALHVLRVALAAAGVQIWVYGLSLVPLWQAIALSMTSPFFVVAGAKLLLGERVTMARLGATIAGFAGAMIIIAPWSERFDLNALLPVAAAALWAGTSLITKHLTARESATTITLYLLLLLTPFNAVIWVAAGSPLPPPAAWLALLIAAGLTVLGQYLLTRAYAMADAVYLQPFDDLKLPLNILLGWLVFGFAPNVGFWPGAALIVAASLFLMRREK